MAICEDAPCCGCCGPAVWAAEDAAAAEWADDPDRWYDEADAWDDEDEADEADAWEDEGGEDAWLDSYMEDRLSGMYG